MELGIYTFVENTPLAETGKPVSPQQRLTQLMKEVQLADEVGLDVYGIGEHHREEYVASAPAVLLAAASQRTKNIRLTSAVNVLSSDDPVRVFQQFSTLDLLSGGRAEIMIGRGSFIESFPLFGYDLNDYSDLFTEKMQMLLHLQQNEVVSWKGKHTQSIQNRGVYPRPVQEKLPVWIAVGGTPESAYRAGALGIPMAMAIIGGNPAQFRAFVELHRRGANEHQTEIQPVSVNSHGLIAEDSKKARDMAFPAFKAVMDKIGRERGWPPMSRAQFDASCEKQGANFVGSPSEIVDKILYQHEILGHSRFLIQMGVGSVPHKDMMKSIELYGTKVAPEVRKAIGSFDGVVVD